MSVAERIASHEWANHIPYDKGECIVVANAVIGDDRTSACTDNEIREAILHALRAYSTGISRECAISRGVIHALCLLEHRLKRLNNGLFEFDLPQA